MIRRVVKVGGSLLKRKDLAQQLLRWIESKSPAENLFLFGGGDVINSVRELDKIHHLDVDKIHWICIDLLDVSFSVASKLFPEWRKIQSQQQCRKLIARKPLANDVIVKCTSFYHPEQARRLQGSLPWDWSTTTDSLAALLATEAKASELVLLKSCEVDGRLSHQEMALQGIVDAAFPNAAKSIASVTVQKLV